MENNVFNIDDYLPNATMPNNAPQTQAPFNIDDYLGVQARDVTGFGEKQAVDFASQLAKFSNADPMKQFEAYEQYRNQYKDHLTGKGYSDTQITQALSEFDEKADLRNQSNWADYFTDFGKSIMAGTGNMFADILAAVPERASVVGMFADAGEKVLRDGARAWEESKSDRFKIQAALGDRAEKAALANGAGELEGLWENLKENPMQVPHLIAGQVPQLALGGLGKIPAGIAFMMGGAGRVRNDIEEAYDKTFKENPAQLLQLPEIQQRMKQGMTFEQAVNEAKTDITDHWENILAGAVIGGSESFSPFNKIGQGVNRGVARTIEKEVRQEMLQESGEQLNSNLAVGKIDGETQPFDQVLRNAALGGIAGLGMALPSAVDAYINRNKQAEDDKLIDELAQAVGSSGNVAENAAATPAPVNEKALEAVLNQANLTPENYDALFDDLKQDIEDGLIAQRASENSAYGKLAQAYLQTAGASVGNESQGAASSTSSTPSTPSALPAAFASSLTPEQAPRFAQYFSDMKKLLTDPSHIAHINATYSPDEQAIFAQEIANMAVHQDPEKIKALADDYNAKQAAKNPQADHYDDNGNLKAAFQAQKTDTEQAKNVDEKRYSLNESADSDFLRSIEDISSGKRKGRDDRYLNMGMTPDVFKMIGLPDTKVSMKESVIDKVTQGKHRIDINDFKNLPNQINNPIAITKSRTKPNGYVVLTELNEDVGGVKKPVIAALHLNQTNNGLEVVNIVSSYGRNISQLNEDIKESLYWNKTKGYPFARTVGLQLPSSLASVDNLSAANIKTEADLRQYQNSSAQTQQVENSPITEQARQMLQKVLGQHADKVRLITRDEVGAEAGVEGYFHNGEAVVVVDNIHADQVFSQAERLAWVAWHELGHAGVNVRLADRYQRIMAHARTHPVVGAIARRVEKSYSANQHTISPERATEEALVEIFAASKTGGWAKLEQDYGVKIHRSWKSGERDVRQFLEKILTYLRRAIGSVMGKNLQQATSGEILAILRQVDNGVANFASKPTAHNDARHSLNENANSDFAQAVDAVAAGKTPVRQYIPMGKTPDVLKMLGIVDTKVLVSRDVLNKVMGGKHNITPDALKQLPAQINNPVAVMKSAPQATQQGYVVLTELVEENNGKQEPVISALHLKRVNSGLEVINIASAYGKGRRGLQNMLNHDLLYWHKTKGSHFLDAFGLQLPAKIASSDVSQSVGNIKTEADLRQYQNGEKRFSRRPKSESLAKLRDAETIKISGRDIQPSSDLRAYKRNALEYGKTLRGAYVNKDTGREISLGRNGITEVLHHDVSNPEHLQSVAAIPQIIENAIYVDTLKNEEANKNGDIQEYDYYVAGLNIGGKDYTVKAVVGTSEKNGERYYDHKLTPMKKGELLSLSYRLSSAGLSENSSPNQGDLLEMTSRLSSAEISNSSPAINDKRLLQILQDENPTASTSPDSPTPESEVRYSRRQSVEDLANTGKAREESSSLFQEMVNRDVDALKKRFDGAMAQLDEALADSWRPVSDWIDQLPTVNEPLKALLKGRMYRAKNLRNVARSNIEQRHMKPIIAMLGRFADKHNISPLTAKRIVGFYGSLRYSIIKNQALLERERLAMEDAKAALDAAQAQGNLSADEMDKLDADYRRAERQYRYRKHDVELAHGSTAEFKVGTAGGWSIPEAQVLMAKFEQQLPKKEMEIVLARLSKLQDDLLNLDELSGRYTPAQLAEYRADKFYVPLTGDPNMEDVDSFIGGSGSRSLNIARDKALKGRKLSEAEDAFDAVWKAVGKSTTFYGWQPFKQTLKDVFDARSSELQAGGLSEKSANEQASAELGIEIKLATAFTRPSDNVLVHKELGKYYTITLPNGMVQRLKDDTLENASVWIKPISTPTRWMAYGVTQLTVDFAPKNMIRDVWDKSDMIRDKTIFDQHGKPLSQKEKNRIGREVWLNMANPKQDIWKATNRFARGAEFDLNNPTEQLMAEFVKYGGLSSFTQHIAQTESDLVKQIKQSGSRSAAMVEQLAGYVQAYNGTFDYVSSLATYKALRDHHIDPEQAASLVLDLANFGKTGAKMRNAKGLFMFLQPKMMGAAALLRSLNTRSGQKRFVAQLVVFGMFYEALRMGFSALFDDDESGNKLDTLGDITGFIPIPIPWADKESERKYWKLHLGFGSAQLAWNMVINTSRAAHGSISFTDAATNIATNWGKVFAPVSPSEISASKDPVAKAVMTLTPSLFQPIMQLGFNRNAFGSPIHTTFENNRAVKAEQGRMNTAAEWSNLAEWIYDATGGAVDAYPESYKHLVEGYALPLGSVREALNIFIENPNRAKLGKTERPVTLRAIVGDTNPFVVQRDYFQAIDEAQTTHKAYERFKEQGKLAGWLTPEKQAEVQFYQRADKQERLLRREKAKQTKALNERKLSQEAYDNWIKHYYTPKADRVQRRFVHEWRKMKGLDTTPSQ